MQLSPAIYSYYSVTVERKHFRDCSCRLFIDSCLLLHALWLCDDCIWWWY